MIINDYELSHLVTNINIEKNYAIGILDWLKVPRLDSSRSLLLVIVKDQFFCMIYWSRAFTTASFPCNFLVCFRPPSSNYAIVVFYGY